MSACRFGRQGQLASRAVQTRQIHYDRFGMPDPRNSKGVRASSPAAIEASRLDGWIGRVARDWTVVRAISGSRPSAVVDRADDLFAFQAEVDAFDVEGGA